MRDATQTLVSMANIEGDVYWYRDPQLYDDILSITPIQQRVELDGDDQSLWGHYVGMSYLLLFLFISTKMSRFGDPLLFQELSYQTLIICIGRNPLEALMLVGSGEWLSTRR